MTSRWGSCQPATGRICINVRLALYPPECLEYVVVHELCHLRERGHGPAFQALMDALPARLARAPREAAVARDLVGLGRGESVRRRLAALLEPWHARSGT